MADDRGLQVGDAVDVHGTVFVGQRDGGSDSGRIGDDRDALAQQGRLEAESRSGVVVAAGDDDVGAGVGERSQRAGEHRIAGRRRCRGVEDVTGHDDRVDGVLTHLTDEHVEHAAEGVESGVPVEGAPDVPVGGVQDAHADTVRRTSDIGSQQTRGRP
ncbi:hypothetical protein QE410_000599 [Microbacterium sp. SORGH_AS 1204]|nr:hypothetical protein [Microbacterium sp. SORGH_AS_1204]